MEKAFVQAMGFIHETNDVTRGENALLCFIYKMNCAGERIIISDLVFSRRFGTGPTVLRKVTGLIDRSLIQTEKESEDLRAKSIVLTATGKKYLAEQGKALMAQIKSNGDKP